MMSTPVPRLGIFVTLMLGVACTVSAETMEKPLVQTGRASWYKGKGSPDVPTAAHRSLPFGTYVRVTNLANNKSVVVKINDRGPFIRGRVIDVNKKAARELDILRRGTAKVRLEVISDSPPGTSF